MITRYWNTSYSIDQAAEKDDSAIQEAAELLRAGKLVAFPTETVYGLGADARSTEAVERIYAAKGRPSDNPLIVHIAERGPLEALVAAIPAQAERLMRRFWPGPLTIVFPLRPGAVSPLVTAGLDTIAIRMPAHPLALKLIAASGCPIAAPSANRSGRPSTTTAAHVLEDMGGRIEGIMDGGPTGVGLESTVVECTAAGVNILRPGGVTAEQLREVAAQVTHDPSLGRAATLAPTGVPLSDRGGADSGGLPGAGRPGVRNPGADEFKPRSPGMKYTHYAPRGRLTIVKGDSPRGVMERIRAEVRQARSRGEKTGVLTFAGPPAAYDADVVIACGKPGDPASAAEHLFAALRTFDQEQVSFILAEACGEEGVGFALMNRLHKAAGGRVIQI